MSEKFGEELISTYYGKKKKCINNPKNYDGFILFC